MQRIFKWTQSVPPALTILGQLSLLMFVGDLGSWVTDYWFKATRLFWEILIVNTIDISFSNSTKDSLTAISIFSVASFVSAEQYTPRTYERIKLRVLTLMLIPATIYILSASVLNDVWILIYEGILGAWGYSALVFRNFLYFIVVPTICYCAFNGGIFTVKEEIENIFHKRGICRQKNPTPLSMVQHISGFIMWDSFLILAIPCTVSIVIDIYHSILNKQLMAPNYSLVFNYFIDPANIAAFSITCVIGFYVFIAIVADFQASRSSEKLGEQSDMYSEDDIASTEFSIEQYFPSVISYMEEGKLGIAEKTRIKILSADVRLPKKLQDLRQCLLNEELEEVIERLDKNEQLTQLEKYHHMQIQKAGIERLRQEIIVLENSMKSEEKKMNPLKGMLILFIAIGFILSVYSVANEIGLINALLALSVATFAWRAFKRNPSRLIRSIVLVCMVLGASFVVELVKTAKTTIESSQGYPEITYVATNH